MLAIIILLIVVLILVLAADIVRVQPPPPPVQESANRRRETTIIVGERVWFPIDGHSLHQADNGYLLIPREETKGYCSLGRREEIVSSFKYKTPKNCVT